MKKCIEVDRGISSPTRLVGVSRRIQLSPIAQGFLLAVAGVSLADAAWAQNAATSSAQGQGAESSGAKLEEILVTAQKRESSIQETPLALTALSGDDLAERQVTDFERLAPSLPSVNFARNVGFARIAIRGLGFDSTQAGQEGRVAFHQDGVYVSRPSAQLSGFFDINRIEVVRGPQGTLYGRNATAGAVNVITNDPGDTFGGSAKVTVGNYSLLQTEGALTGPVNDAISARLAFVTTDHSGYGYNSTTRQEIDNEHSYSVRGKVKVEPSSTFNLLLSAEYSHQDDNNFVYRYLGAGKPTVVPTGLAIGGTVPSNRRDSFANNPQLNERRFSALNATANWDVGFGTLTSVTGYRDSDTHLLSDADGTSAPIARAQINEVAHQLSEELRFAGDIGTVSYLFGGYYFREEVWGQSNFSPVRSPVPALAGAQVQGLDYVGDLDTKAYAAFGQLDWRPLPGLTLSAGLRYSYEERAIDQVGLADLTTPYNPDAPYHHNLLQNDDTDFDSFTPRFSIDYQATDDILIYLTYAKGFKSGGFSLTAFSPPLRPETLTDYEGGIKTEWLEGKLRVNLAAFYYDYTDLQVSRLLGNQAQPVNAASAEVKGVEGEFIIIPVEGLEISGNGAWLDAEFTTFVTVEPARVELGQQQLAGNRLPQAPRYTANLAAQYTKPIGKGELAGRVEGAWAGHVYFSPFNRPETSQASYGKYNASMTWNDDSGWSASLFIRNITNKLTLSTGQVSLGFLGYPIMGALDPPRTYGGSVSYRF